jgi:hypothetical protein
MRLCVVVVVVLAFMVDSNVAKRVREALDGARDETLNRTHNAGNQERDSEATTSVAESAQFVNRRLNTSCNDTVRCKSQSESKRR